MAEVIGFLRSDATYGEQQVLKLLRQNLPKEFTVYVETPIHKERDIRYPDFIILTNYGVIVLEVKDWVIIERVDPKGATIHTRNGDTRYESNPVNTARDYAIALSNELNSRRNHGQPCEAIPWSYASVLYNLPPSVITQLRVVWGKEFVLGKADLDNPNVLLNQIKMTFPPTRMRPLAKEELELIRATIYPVVEIQMEGRPTVILDEQQEKIVAEPIREELQATPKKIQKEEEEQQQEQLFESFQNTPEENETLPLEGERISQNISIRLVRGFSGSGKTLVLMQRARFLAAQFPDWNIGVLTFNKPLQEQLEQTFKGTSITPRTFHSICHRWINTPENLETNFPSWIRENQPNFSILTKLGVELIDHEIDWLRDMGAPTRDEYRMIERRGIGKDRRLSVEDRDALYNVFEAYREYLHKTNHWDWGEIPLLMLQAIEQGGIVQNYYDAVLIDEAQDWAPVWFKVINHLINPEHGVIFMADDPSQSIYRYFSWKEKGINVMGRTRWLKVPYRNTYEIYRAAYSMISTRTEIQKSLMEEGEIIEPELSSQEMRHGPLPLIRKYRNQVAELINIKDLITSLRQDGFPEKQIAVLVRYRRDLEPIQNTFRGMGVGVYPIHSFKGLEMEVVIIPYIQNTFINAEEETSDRRLLYMAMSRARSRLYLTYSGKLPQAYEDLRLGGLADFIG